MKNSLNPVLVSAELWGRHFYAGKKLPTRFCVVNDKVNGQTLEPTLLKWEITYKDNRVISSGTYQIPAVNHYNRHWENPDIILPDNFDGERLDGKIRLFLVLHGEIIAQNEYDLLIAKKDWVTNKKLAGKKIVLVDYTGETKEQLIFFNIEFKEQKEISKAFKEKADVYIISGLSQKNITGNDYQIIRDKFNSGANILLLNTGEQVLNIFPEYISGYLQESLETAHIDIPESNIFNGIKYMDLRYFNNNEPEKPLVYNGLIQVTKSPSINSLASGCEHRYARIQDRRKEMLTMKGFPIISIENGGKSILSKMFTNKGIYDPVEGKLLMNMIFDLSNENN